MMNETLSPREKNLRNRLLATSKKYALEQLETLTPKPENAALIRQKIAAIKAASDTDERFYCASPRGNQCLPSSPELLNALIRKF
jgi:hypothetical protein